MLTHKAKRRKLSPSPQIAQKAEQSNESKLNNYSKIARNEPSSMDGLARRKNIDRSAELALASGVYKSNLFKLQLDELLTESRPNYGKHVSKLQDILHKLKEVIEQIPERPPKPAIEAEKEIRNTHGIVVPYPEPLPGKDTKYTVSYNKPTNVNVVGSFVLRTGVRASEPYTVDLAVTMPNTVFQEKDYVNHRFFHKRAYYIACLASGIKEAGDINFDIKFAQQDGDSLRPLILLNPTDSTKSGSQSVRYQIRIFTAIEDKLFPIGRTLPMKNNVRQGSPDQSESCAPTPFYNAALRSEATVAPFHKLLYSTAQMCDSFRDACILGRIWLRQRGFGSSFQQGGFGGFEWTILMALLFEGGGFNGKPILLKSYSSYQLFKATIQFLAGKNLLNPLLLFASDIPSPTGTPTLYDGKRGLNILYKMSPWSYSLLRYEADIALRMLNESRDDNFDKVFIYKVNEPMLRFDRLITLPVSESGTILRTIRNHNVIYEVLKKALGDRAELIFLFSNGAEPWSVGKKFSHKSTSATIQIGLNLHPENAMRVVDHGPFAEQKDEAAAFRSFWGEKAELRRFRDGTIRESLVWSDQLPSPSIVYQLLVYILHRHFNYAEDEISYIGDEFDEKLRNSEDGIPLYSSPAFQLVTDAFNSLERSFQSLEEVPLTVRQLALASPLGRYSALRVQSSGLIRDPVDIVLQFESSSRWPDDLVAIQMTKVAFLIKIGDSLVSSGAASSCKVGLENESSRTLNNAFLDISHTSGVIFRMRIHHDREQLLLERQLKEKETSLRAKQEAAYNLSAYKRLFIQSPRLTQAIRTLCTRFPSLSPTIRLVKHWFACHLFTGYVNEEVIELVVAKVFTQPYPWDTPSSVMVGFLRTLHFLARWDWQQDPLIVDLGGELNQDTLEAIHTRFSGWRRIDPAMNTVALFVASDIDPDGVTWTQHEMPPKVVAARMSMLAKGAVKLVQANGLALDVSDLFQTSLAPYDFIVKLRTEHLHDRSTSLLKYKNLNGLDSQGQTANLKVVGPFVRDLQACFGPNVLFFHGDENCDMLAGVWNPQTAKPKSWSLKLTYSSSPSTGGPTKKDDEVTINRDAIFNEISRLGSGLVDSIEVFGTK
ncbi:Nrap protein [Aspergillus bertholletiae]|uniref:U3 small nucleolar RNA-associated protein 22 n=1 Tax=Aspergillus bertholletiae TaxID=1226010 RepID=A0A5N7B2F1_9EURO|nr:Nrap protein [Aspergillus bertholletiae]